MDENRTPTRVTWVPGPQFLGTLTSLVGLFGGLLYVTVLGTEFGVLPLIGVCIGALALYILGFLLRQNNLIVEADAQDMILRPHPLHIGRTRRIPQDDIGGFMTEMTGTDKSGTPRYALTILRFSKGPRRLAYFDTLESAAREAEEKLTAFFT